MEATQNTSEKSIKKVHPICTLQETLAYKNDMIVYKFMESYKVSFEEAEDLFNETKKWLWLCAYARTLDKKPRLAITRSLRMLDKMWHTFILFTKEYTSFCEKYFGHYVHHSPTSKHEKDQEKEQKQNNKDAFLNARKEEYTQLYGFIYDHLGADTLQKWYSDYLDKYTSEHMNNIRIPE